MDCWLNNNNNVDVDVGNDDYQNSSYKSMIVCGSCIDGFFLTDTGLCVDKCDDGLWGFASKCYDCI